VAETGLPFRYVIVLFEGFQYEPPPPEVAQQFASLAGVDEDFPVIADEAQVLAELVSDWSGLPHTKVVLGPDLTILDVHVGLADEEDAKAFAVIREHAGLSPAR